MKKREIIRINIYLILIMLVGLFTALSFIGFMMELVEHISSVILIIVFCYVLYKGLIIEGRN